MPEFVRLPFNPTDPVAFQNMADIRLDEIEKEEGVFGYLPNAIAPRILSQKGLFTVHCDAKQPIEVAHSRTLKDRPNLIQMVIPAKLKSEVLKLLGDYGIDRSVLFPDLDGLSADVNSRTANMRRPA